MDPSVLLKSIFSAAAMNHYKESGGQRSIHCRNEHRPFDVKGQTLIHNERAVSS